MSKILRIGGKDPSENLKGIAVDENGNVITGGNSQGFLLASAARTTGASSALQTNFACKGVLIWLNVTAASGTGGLKVVVHGVDPISGLGGYLNPEPVPINSVRLTGYVIYPGIADAIGGTTIKQTSSVVLPRIWYIHVFHVDSSSYTYSVSYSYLL
ncbi:MAG: hypothetical protein MI740_10525 [Halanaerobiales bacterium]|nr:hypothetical protein [Halanaerobiales bacterium]